MRRAFLAALSFANLSYLRVWSELLTYHRYDTYLMVTPPKPVHYFAVIANVLLAAVAIWGLSILAGRVLKGRSSRFAEMAVVLGMCIPLNALRAVLSNRLQYLRSPLIILLGTRGVMLLGVSIAVAGLIAIVFFHRRLAAAAIAVLVMLSPFCAVTFGQGLWKAAQYDASQYANKPPVPMIAGARRLPRVLWFIADEWDYRLSFVDRDPSLALPEIDRLRKGAIDAGNALPPGPETPISIPAYYGGRPVSWVVWDGPRQLLLGYPGTNANPVPWSAQPNVFERAGALGGGEDAGLLAVFLADPGRLPVSAVSTGLAASTTAGLVFAGASVGSGVGSFSAGLTGSACVGGGAGAAASWLGSPSLGTAGAATGEGAGTAGARRGTGAAGVSHGLVVKR